MEFLGRKEEEGCGHTVVVVVVHRPGRVVVGSRWLRGRGLLGRLGGFALGMDVVVEIVTMIVGAYSLVVL